MTRSELDRKNTHGCGYRKWGSVGSVGRNSDAQWGISVQNLHTLRIIFIHADNTVLITSHNGQFAVREEEIGICDTNLLGILSEQYQLIRVLLFMSVSLLP